MNKPGSTFHPSILNTILGPITLGPSSSHFAGPVRLGKLARSLFGFRPKRVEIVFDEGSSFAATYKGHHTDCALVGGILGWDPDNEQIPQAFEKARQEGLIANVVIRNLALNHPNVVFFYATGEDGEEARVLGTSEGGGAIRVSKVDGYDTDLDGQRYALLLVLHSEEAVEDAIAVIKEVASGCKVRHCQGRALTVEQEEKLPSCVVNELGCRLKPERMLQIEPVFLSPRRDASDAPLFTSAQELLEIARADGNMTISELGLRYEMNRLGWPRQEVREEIGKMVYVMRNALALGLAEDFQYAGLITRRGGRPLLKALEQGKTICSGTLPKATAYAMAIYEVCVSQGLVVAAPTAGACGVLPAAIFAAAEELHLEKSEDVLVDALLCAGAIGAIFAQRATFLAELCGCQVESGIAAGMGAASIVEMKGGAVEQALNAASLTLQNVLGLECDPVAGLQEVPCLTRNALGAVNALMSADIAMLGVNQVMPFDEVVDAVYETGRFRPMQCNGSGGLAVTPTSNRIRETMGVLTCKHSKECSQ